MDVAYKGVSLFYTGKTDLEFKFVTATTNDLLLGFILSYDTKLTPSLPDGWIIYQQLENEMYSGTTFLLKYHPSGLTVNPTWQFGNLSGKFNGGCVIFLSGCTKSRTKDINVYSGVTQSNTVNITSTINNTMFFEVVGLWGTGGTINSFNLDTHPMTQILQEKRRSDTGYELMMGIAYSNKAINGSHTLDWTSTGTSSKFNTHAFAVRARTANSQIFMNS